MSYILYIFLIIQLLLCLCCFFFNDTATTEIYTLSLHDALPICSSTRRSGGRTQSVGANQSTRDTAAPMGLAPLRATPMGPPLDRKSTRLNSSHSQISYAVFCLKKKKKKNKTTITILKQNKIIL